MALAVIAGLGNPGSEYAQTRHNIGAIFVDNLASHLGATWSKEKSTSCDVARVPFEGSTITLLRPLTFMNESGQALGVYARYHKLLPESMIVAYDDITLEPGRLRVTQRGSDGGHNGVASILKHLGNGFVRYRIGIGGKPHPEMQLTDWVLGRFTSSEKAVHEDRMTAYQDGLRLLLREGVERAMNQINTRNSKSKSHESNSNPNQLPSNIHTGSSQLPGASRDDA